MTDINVSLRELKLVVGRLLFVSGLPRGCVYPVRDVLVDAQTLGLDAVQSLEDTLDRLPGDAGAVLVRAESPGSLIVDAVGAPSYLVAPAILDLMVAAVRRRGASDVQVVNVALPGLLRALEVSATRHGVGIELCETADERARLRGAAGIQPIDDPTDPAALTEVQLRAVRAGFDIDVDLWWRMAKPSDDDLTPDSDLSRRHAGASLLDAGGKIIGEVGEDDDYKAAAGLAVEIAE